MNKFNYMTLAVAALALTSCADDAFRIPQEETPAVEYPANLKRALEISETFIGNLDGGKTRATRRISTIECLGTSTRSGSDESWYIVNYDNGAGFALMTDADVPNPVYGFSNTGSLSISDTIHNKALAIVFNNILATSSLEERQQVDSQTDTRAFPNIIPPSIVYEYKPVLTPTVSNWGQGEPFNALCAMVTNGVETKRGYVGSIPLAVAMTMSHYSWPDTYYSKSPDETYEFYWDQIRDSKYRYVISRLTREVSRAYNLDAQWFYEGTEAKWHWAPQTFENFKYTRPTIQNALDILDTTLERGFPVLCCAQGSAAVSGEKDPEHAWVVDGKVRYQLNDFGMHFDDQYTYFHCVWGWDGDSNGYYVINPWGFDKSDGLVVPGYSQQTRPDMPKYTDIQAIGELSPRK